MLKTFLAAAALLSLLPAQAALTVGSTSFTYSQNFDSLGATTAASVAWVNDTTLAGWSLFDKDGAAITSYAVNDGSSNAGSFYSFGAASATERALGGTASGGAYFGTPASGAVAGYIALSFTNATGAALNGFTLGFAGEQWRNGGNTTAQTMAMQWGIGSSFASVSSWASLGSTFNWASPVVSATAAAVNGNVAGRVSNVGGSFVTNGWNSGTTLWLRWVENNDVGNDHGLAIDDLSFSVSAVPEPGTWALWLAGAAAVSAVARRRRA